MDTTVNPRPLISSSRAARALRIPRLIVGDPNTTALGRMRIEKRLN